MNVKNWFNTLVAGAFGIAASQSAVLVDWDFSGLDWRTGQGSGLALNDPAPNPILTSTLANAAAGLTSSDLTPSPDPGGLHVVVNDTQVSGTIVPEPASLALVGLGCLTLLRRRRA